MDSTWTEVKRLFSAALELDEKERASFLKVACPANDAVRAEVFALLSAHKSASGFIDSPALVDLGMMSEDDLNNESAVVGKRIGPYEIVRELGHGGMGTVYLAVRADDQYRKQVAIKVVNRGMDTDLILRRFTMERQILANLEHTNIARLLEGGSTDDGLPYFVMEYIEGQPINRYCDAQLLSTRERLELFRQVCSALHYAHQNLVVHRDIKPSNILVTSEGVPKLLDFGIAKLLSPGWDADAGEITASMVQLMTPEYASPEQLRGLTITTSSDVYSLGIVLYELLSGRHPFRLASRQAREVASVVLQSEPKRPSDAIADFESRISESRDEGNVTSRQPPGLPTNPKAALRNPKSLRGDIDNIVLKALRKEPPRRYASVQEFSEDIRRHLDGLPVLASPDTFGYRAGKFVQRNKVAVLAASVVVITLISATAITAWQARVARQERAKAERRFRDVRNLTNSFLFDFHDAIADLSGATKAREMVVKKAQEYLDSLAQEAGDDRELLWELSTAYLKLGDVQGRPGFSRTGDTGSALQSYEKSLETRRRLVALQPDNTEYQLGLAITLSRFGPLFQVLGKPASAVERMREATAITDKLLPGSHDLTTYQTATRNPAFLGDALAEVGNYDEALAMYQKCLTLAEQNRAPFPDAAVKHRFAVCRERLGFIFAIKGDYQKSLENHMALATLEQELSAVEPTNIEYARAMATGLDHVGDAYRGLGNYGKALENGRRAFAMYEDFLKQDPQNARGKKDLGDCSHHVAETLLASGDYRGALAMSQRAVGIRRELVALDATNVEYPDDLAESLMLTGECYAAGRNPARAIESFQEARAICEPIVAAHRQRIDYSRGLARLYTDMGNTFVVMHNRNEAEIWYRKAIDLWTELQGQHALWAKDLNLPKEVDENLSQIHSRKT
ncbi:MAG TPA: serine/threonine-protein kinase [Pyrinomonadaceae bacterium]|nr:serine/threonine-protein kinase [Pyrinomonadaceae bacterium]